MVKVEIGGIILDLWLVVHRSRRYVVVAAYSTSTTNAKEYAKGPQGLFRFEVDMSNRSSPSVEISTLVGARRTACKRATAAIYLDLLDLFSISDVTFLLNKLSVLRLAFFNPLISLSFHSRNPCQLHGPFTRGRIHQSYCSNFNGEM